MRSEDYIYHCSDIIRNDKNISDATIVTMFVEFKKKILSELSPEQNNPWLTYPENKPKCYGKFEVYRSGCDKQHYETWNGTGWAYNNRDITHFRFIVNPKGFLMP